MPEFMSLLASSFVVWIILAFLIVRFKLSQAVGIPLNDKMVFWGVIVIGLFFTGTVSTLFSGGLVSAPKTSAVSSDSLGSLSLLPVTGGSNFTIQDGSNKYQCNVEAAANKIDEVSASNGNELNCTFTIQRTGPLQAASCEVKLKDNPSYINPYDDTDDKTYYVLARDSFKKPKLYFDSVTYQESKVIGFGEGTSSATVLVYADITKKDFSNITNFGTKQLTIDICGQKTLPILIRRTN